MALSDAQYQTQFETYLLVEKRVSVNTFDAYKRDIVQFLAYLQREEKSVATCGETDLKLYVRSLHKNKLAARSSARKISALKLFFSYLSEQYAEIGNHAQRLLFPKIEKQLPVYLSEEEVEKLLMIAQEDTSLKGTRNLVMLHLLYASGMRISELVQMTSDQYHPDTGYLSINGKGNKQREVPLPQSVSTTFRYYVEEVYPHLVPTAAQASGKRYLFASVRKGKLQHMTRQTFWVLLKTILRKSGIRKEVSPHTLRHSLATHLLRAGADIRSLQLLLGHEQIDTVEIYTHIDTQQLRKIYDAKHPRA